MKPLIFYSIEKYCSSLLTALFFFVLAGNIHIDDLAVFNYSEAIVGLLSFFCFYGLEQISQRELVKKKYSESEILSTLGYVKFLGSIAILFCLLVSYFFIDWSVYGFVLISCTVTAMIRSFVYINSYYISIGNYKIIFSVGILASIVSFVIKMIVLFEISDVGLVSLTFIIEPVILVSAFIYLLYQDRIRINIFDYNSNILSMYFSEGKYLVFSGLIILLYSKIDQIMIENYLLASDLANYSLAIKVTSLFILGSTVVSLAFLPKLDPSNQRYYLVCRKLMMTTIVIGTMLSAICYLISPQLLNYFYGEEFSLSSDIVKVSSMLVLLSFLLSTTGRILVNASFTKLIVKRNLGALLINVLLNFYFIPKFGAIGAMYASVVSFFFSSIFYLCLNASSRSLFISIFKGCGNYES